MAPVLPEFRRRGSKKTSSPAMGAAAAASTLTTIAAVLVRKLRRSGCAGREEWAMPGEETNELAESFPE
jgi:hypothetical protein